MKKKYEEPELEMISLYSENITDDILSGGVGEGTGDEGWD